MGQHASSEWCNLWGIGQVPPEVAVAILDARKAVEQELSSLQEGTLTREYVQYQTNQIVPGRGAGLYTQEIAGCVFRRLTGLCTQIKESEKEEPVSIRINPKYL